MGKVVCTLFFMWMTLACFGQASCDSLFAYVKTKQLAKAKACLDAGASANSEEIVYLDWSTKDNPTIYEARVRVLYYAIQNNDTAMTRLLLNRGASPNKGRWLGRDTTDIPPYRYDRGGINTPLGAVVEGESGDAMRKLLLKNKAKTAEYQIQLGRRLWLLAGEARKNPDSLVAFQKLLADHPDEIDFSDNYWKDVTFSSCCLYNLLSGIRYMVENNHADFESKKWAIPTVNVFTRTWTYEEFRPILYITFGKFRNLETTEYFLGHYAINNSEYDEYLLKNSSTHLRRFYELKAKLVSPEMSQPGREKERAKIERKMKKLYNKVQKKHPSV